MKRFVVLRPEPGNAATVARLQALGRDAEPLPMFAIAPRPWTAEGAYDSLLLTSANAVRFAGDGLGALSHLPAVAVGEATAQAAREAGLSVAAIGSGDAEGALAALAAHGFSRALHLAGHDHLIEPGGPVAEVAIVYASEPLPLPSDLDARLAGSIVLVHSPRAGARLATLVSDRATVTVAAISENAARACGDGWARILVAAQPDEASLIAAALTAADASGIRGHEP